MNLTFTPLKLSHCKEIYHANTGNVAEYFFDFANLDATKQWIKKTLIEVSECKKLEFVVFDGVEFIGMAAIWLHPNDTGEISLWVAPSQQNKSRIPTPRGTIISFFSSKNFILWGISIASSRLSFSAKQYYYTSGNFNLP